MEKVECRTVVEMRGDDMAHIVGDLVRERLIEPYVDADLRAFDLSIEHRNHTNDTVTLEATQALKVHNARGVKGATITAEKDVLEKQKRTRMSPNDAIRKALGGDVFRKVMVCRSIPPLANQWRRPIIIPRHVFGDQYNGQDVMVPGPGTLQIKHSPTVGAAYNYHVMQAYLTTGGQVSLVVNICQAMSMLEETLNALKLSAVAIEVVPQQLESRRVRCKEAVRHLTERWHRASGGEGFRDGSHAPNMAEDVTASAALDADEADELFETIEALERPLDDIRGQLKWAQEMAAVNEAQVKDYKDLAKHLEQDLRKQRDSADRELAIRVRNACEITRFQLYRREQDSFSEQLLSDSLAFFITHALSIMRAANDGVDTANRRVELNPEQATEDELDESDPRERPWNTASCSGRALTVPKFMSRQILGVVYGRI